MHALFFLTSQFDSYAQLEVQSTCDFLSVRLFVEEHRFKERDVLAQRKFREMYNNAQSERRREKHAITVIVKDSYYN